MMTQSASTPHSPFPLALKDMTALCCLEAEISQGQSNIVSNYYMLTHLFIIL